MEGLGNLRGRTFAVGLILGLVIYGVYYGLCFQPLYRVSNTLMGHAEQVFTVAVPGGAQKGAREHLAFSLRLEYPRYLVTFGTQEVWMLITREAPRGQATSNAAVHLRVSLKARVEGGDEHQGSIPWVACSVPTSGNRCPQGKQALEFDLAPGEQTVGVWYVVLLEPGTAGERLHLKPQVLRRTEQGWKHMEVNRQEQTKAPSDSASDVVVKPAQGFDRVKVLGAILIRSILLPPWSNVFLVTLAYILARTWSRYWRWWGIQGPQYEEEKKQRKKEKGRKEYEANMLKVLEDLSRRLQPLQGLAGYEEHLRDALNALPLRLSEMNNDLSAELSKLVAAVNALRKDDGEAGTAPAAEPSPSGEEPSPKDEAGESPSPPTEAPSSQAPSHRGAQPANSKSERKDAPLEGAAEQIE